MFFSISLQAGNMTWLDFVCFQSTFLSIEFSFWWLENSISPSPTFDYFTTTIHNQAAWPDKSTQVPFRYDLHQQSSNFSEEGLLNPRFLDPIPRNSDSIGLGRGPRICISHNFPTDTELPSWTDGSGLGTTLWGALVYTDKVGRWDVFKN